MNEIAKQRISERVVESLNKELLSKNVAGPMIGIHPSYLSCVCNPEKLNKCPDDSWEVLQKWVNSGLTIKQWAEKRQKEGNYSPLVPIREVKKESDTITLKDIKSDPELLKEAEGLKYKTITTDRLHPVNLEKKQEPRLSRGEMVDLLLAEKALLKTQIEAIDVLLKHYIS